MGLAATVSNLLWTALLKNNVGYWYTFFKGVVIFGSKLRESCDLRIHLFTDQHLLPPVPLLLPEPDQVLRQPRGRQPHPERRGERQPGNGSEGVLLRDRAHRTGKGLHAEHQVLKKVA